MCWSLPSLTESTFLCGGTNGNQKGQFTPVSSGKKVSQVIDMSGHRLPL